MTELELADGTRIQVRPSITPGHLVLIIDQHPVLTVTPHEASKVASEIFAAALAQEAACNN